MSLCFVMWVWVGVTSPNFIVKLSWKEFYFIVLPASGACEVLISPHTARVTSAGPHVLQKCTRCTPRRQDMQSGPVGTGREMHSSTCKSALLRAHKEGTVGVSAPLPRLGDQK